MSNHSYFCGVEIDSEKAGDERGDTRIEIV